MSIAPFFLGSVERAARRAFVRLGIARTRERNGVLLFVVPARRELYVLGDEGLHAKVGQKLWDDVAREVSLGLAAGEPTPAILLGVKLVGAELARCFPAPAGGHVNQLPDQPDI